MTLRRLQMKSLADLTPEQRALVEGIESDGMRRILKTRGRMVRVANRPKSPVAALKHGGLPANPKCPWVLPGLSEAAHPARRHCLVFKGRRDTTPFFDHKRWLLLRGGATLR